MLKNYITKALAKLPSNASEAQKSLLKALASRIPAEDLEQIDPDLFTDMVNAQWDLAKNRKSGERKISIKTPLLKGHSYRKTVIDFVNDDMAFLVDSIAAEINKKNSLIELLLHPIIYVRHDKNGKLIDASDTPKDGYTRQSHIRVRIRETLSEEQLKSLETDLSSALEDVFIANRDWKPMLAKLKEAREELTTAKTKHGARSALKHRS